MALDITRSSKFTIALGKDINFRGQMSMNRDEAILLACHLRNGNELWRQICLISIAWLFFRNADIKLHKLPRVNVVFCRGPDNCFTCWNMSNIKSILSYNNYHENHIELQCVVTEDTMSKANMESTKLFCRAKLRTVQYRYFLFLLRTLFM